jgi:cytidine deaminase
MKGYSETESEKREFPETEPGRNEYCGTDPGRKGYFVTELGRERDSETSEEIRIQELICAASAQLAHSYAPYSDFKVGAALLAEDGRIFTGCNIENAAYTPSNCAERTAFFKAVSEGVRGFRAICIVGGKSGNPTGYVAPCGVCRQVMMEFCDPETFRIILAYGRENYKIFRLKDLMPEGFGPADLNA